MLKITAQCASYCRKKAGVRRGACFSGDQLMPLIRWRDCDCVALRDLVAGGARPYPAEVDG